MFFIHHREFRARVARQHKCTEYRRQAIRTEDIWEFSGRKIPFCVEIQSCMTSFHRFLPHCSSPVIQTLGLSHPVVCEVSYTLSVPHCLQFKFLISVIMLKWLYRIIHAISLKTPTNFKSTAGWRRNAYAAIVQIPAVIMGSLMQHNCSN